MVTALGTSAYKGDLPGRSCRDERGCCQSAPCLKLLSALEALEAREEGLQRDGYDVPSSGLVSFPHIVLDGNTRNEPDTPSHTHTTSDNGTSPEP